MPLKQEWLNRPRKVDFRFRARLRSELALWLVVKYIRKVLLPLEEWSAVCPRLFTNERKFGSANVIAFIG